MRQVIVAGDLLGQVLFLAGQGLQVILLGLQRCQVILLVVVQRHKVPAKEPPAGHGRRGRLRYGHPPVVIDETRRVFRDDHRWRSVVVEGGGLVVGGDQVAEVFEIVR